MLMREPFQCLVFDSPRKGEAHRGRETRPRKFKERTGKLYPKYQSKVQEMWQRQTIYHTSCASNLRFACIRSASAGVGKGAGVRGASSANLLATVFVGLTCNTLLPLLGGLVPDLVGATGGDDGPAV